jgi:adenosylmethionine-8-amino-7-oxononanoate aminotransferase
MIDHRYPHSSVFYRSLVQNFPKITHGEGASLYDERGKRYLDACGGAYVVNVGHGVREIAEAMARQASKIAYVNGTAFTNGPAEDLAVELARLNPTELSKSYFLSSGSEAVEAALKLARHHWVAKRMATKRKIIALDPGYHGNTLLALSTSSRRSYKDAYEPWLVPVRFMPAPYAYRCECGGEPSCPACSGNALESAILAEGPDQVAAVIAEPVGGSSTGAAVPRSDYWRNVRAICDRHGILWIADEVLSGAGRTGKWSALEHFGAVPDILVMGKGLSGGYAPLSCVSTSEKLLEPILKADGGFKHAQTYSHTPLICAAGLACVRYLKSRGLIERAGRVGGLLGERLKEMLQLPGVGDVRGLGMLWAVEFVADKETKKPFPRELRACESLAAAARDQGLVVWPNPGHWKGEGDLVLLAPPFVISEGEIEEAIFLLKTSWEKTLDQLTVKRK